MMFFKPLAYSLNPLTKLLNPLKRILAPAKMFTDSLGKMNPSKNYAFMLLLKRSSLWFPPVLGCD